MQTIRLIFALFFSLFFGFVVTTQAQPSLEMRQARKEIRQKVHTYIKENVFPTVKTQRAKFDNALSAEHKARIAELRAEAKPLRDKMRAKRQAFMQKKGNHEVSENQKYEMRETHKKLCKIMLEAWTIADEYENELKAIKTELKPQKETWKTEIKAIFEANMTDEMRQKMQERRQKMEEYGHKPNRHGRGLGLKKMMHPAHFILLDPNGEMPELPNAFEEDIPSDKALVFPNPSQDANTLKFDVKEAGQVQIDLISANGEIVKSVLSESKSVGKHSVKTSLQNLRAGIYYYKITTKLGTETKRFVIE